MNGRMFRQEQRQRERVQAGQARHQLNAARQQQEAARLRRARAEPAQRERQAREEAERQRQERLREEELRREQLRQEQLRQERLRQEEQLRLRQEEMRQEQLRQEQLRLRLQATMERNQRRAAQVQREEELRRQREAQAQARQREQLHGQQETELYEAMSQLQGDLPALNRRCTPLIARVRVLIVLLAGSDADELDTAQTDLVSLQTIANRCNTNGGQVANGLNQLRPLHGAPLHNAVALLRVTLLPMLGVRANDDNEVTAIDGRTTAAEQTYRAARALVAAYPNLGLTLSEINHDRGVIARLNDQQLARLNTKLAGTRVQAWQTVRMPGSRVNFTRELLRIPLTLAYFDYIPSGEVFHDWVWENAGHGQPAADIQRALSPQGRLIQLFGPYTEEVLHDRTVYTHRNFVCRIVISGHTGDAGRTLITYYKRD